MLRATKSIVCRVVTHTPMKYVFTFLLLLSMRQVQAQITYEQVAVDYDSAWDFRNIRIIPIRSKGPGLNGIVSLADAMKNGWVTVSERGTSSTENVHWLRINNHTDQPVYISSGEMITGGRQDRIVSRDTVLHPTGGDQYVPAMCVEEGRWSEKEKKFQYAGYTNSSLRKVIDGSRNQVLIWKEIYDQLELLPHKSPTLAYSSIRAEKKYLPEEAAYRQYMLERFRNSDSSLVGFIAVSGNRIIGADVFSSGSIFYAELSSLLSGYIETAIVSGSAPVVETKEVKLYADSLLSDESTQAAYCKKNGKLFRYAGAVFHVASY